MPHIGGGGSVGYHIMPVLLPRGADRGAVMEALREEGIQSSIHYPPAHRFTAVPDEERTSLPRTEDVAARELTLPFFPSMTAQDVQQVCRALGRAVG